MNPAKLHRRWRRRLKRLLCEVQRLVRQCRRRGDAAAVHELRVAVRRSRLLLRVGRRLVDPDLLREYRTWARAATRATSRVRDLDVAIEWLTAWSADSEILDGIRRRRDRCWRVALPRLQMLPPRLPSGLLKAASGGPAARRLARRYAKVVGRLIDATRADGFRFDELTPIRQHQFRRTLRWWRYLRELGRPRRRHARDRLLQQLIAVQEAIGERQNGELTLQGVDRLKATSAVRALLSRLQRDRAAREVEIRKRLQALIVLMEWQRSAGGTRAADSAGTRRTRPRRAPTGTGA